ncbi:unnamed protein product [Coregonus sp. 'balchen']|nr:unnamed protein product [Coregonus sp. 'balchen']
MEAGPIFPLKKPLKTMLTSASPGLEIVRTWNTFSSPWVISHAGYGTGQHPPEVKDYVFTSYQVKELASLLDFAEPPSSSSNPKDVAAADCYLLFILGWFAHPIFMDGDYPVLLKSQIEQKRRDCPHSVPAILPVFTAE